MLSMSCAVTRGLPSTEGSTSTSAPSARRSWKRSSVKQSAITIRARYPFALQTSASDGPVLPPVYSTTVSPGEIRPSRSAPSIIASAMRSFIEPVGLRYSSLSHSSAPFAGAQRLRRTNGVPPIVSRIDAIARRYSRRTRAITTAHATSMTAENTAPEHAAQLVRVYNDAHRSLTELLEESLDPPGPDSLLDAAAPYLRPGSLILDVGCRDAKHLIELVRRHDCRGVGLDPVEWHVERARAAVDEAGLASRVEITRGVVESIDRPDDEFDFVWCRDVLVHVEGLEQGLREAARVSKRGAAMLVYTVLA